MTSPAELFDLSGKVALVTGGASGLGRQMAEALGEMGADLTVCARRAERCDQAAEELRGMGVRTLGLGCDVRDPEQVQAVVARTAAEFGRIDILVNNAGTGWTAPAEETSLEGWQKVIDVNLTGVFLFAQAVGRVLIRQGSGGKIVNIASIAALVGAQPEVMDTIAYNASKGGVLAFTRDLAVKWARHRINVNAIAPGWFPTEMAGHVLDRHADTLQEQIPLGRFGGPDDLKGTVVYLASAASDYMTGQLLVVDGGQTAW